MKWAVSLLILGAIGVIAVHLAGAPAETGSTAVLGMRPFETTRIDGEAWPKRLFDPSGFEQIMSAPPRRIASTSLGSDEILCALFDDEPERIVALTTMAADTGISNCHDLVPPGTARFAGSLESVIETEPDLVICSPGTRAEIIRIFVSAGIPVVRFGRWSTLEDLKGNIRLIGKAVGRRERAEEIVAWMDRRIRRVEERVAGRPRPRVLYWNPNGFTTGGETTMGEMIVRAGGINVAEEAAITRTMQLPTEFAVSLEPDVILISTRAVVRTIRGIEPSDSPVREIMNDPRWKDAPAVKNGRVHVVKAGWATSVSHYPVLALEAMARSFHPDVFADGDTVSVESELYAALHPTLVRKRTP